MVRIEGLKVHFPIKKGFLQRTTDHVRAVDGVDLEIGRGKILALVGESGCGKTTLGKAIIRLIEPTAGTVHYEGQDLLEQDTGAMRQHRSEVQIIFQDPFSSLNPRMMIGDTISEGLAAQGWGKNRNDRLDMSRRALAQAQMDPDVVTDTPTNSPAARGNASALRGAWPCNPSLSSAMRSPALWMCRSRLRFCNCCWNFAKHLA